MFKDNDKSVTNECVWPDRLLYLATTLKWMNKHIEGPVDRNALTVYMELKNDIKAANHQEIGHTLKAAEEIGLIESDNGYFKFIGDSSSVENIEAFRQFAADKIFKNTNAIFFKMTEWYIASNDKINSLSGIPEYVAAMQKDGIKVNNDTDTRTWQKWMYFLGEAMPSGNSTIPCMALRMKSEFRKLEKGTVMRAGEFIAWVMKTFPEAQKGIDNENRQLPLAMSIGLTVLESEGLIEMQQQYDADKVLLFTNNLLEKNQFSAIAVKEALYE